MYVDNTFTDQSFFKHKILWIDVRTSSVPLFFPGLFRPSSLKRDNAFLHVQFDPSWLTCRHVLTAREKTTTYLLTGRRSMRERLTLDRVVISNDVWSEYAYAKNCSTRFAKHFWTDDPIDPPGKSEVGRIFFPPQFLRGFLFLPLAVLWRKYLRSISIRRIEQKADRARAYVLRRKPRKSDNREKSLCALSRSFVCRFVRPA